MTLTLTAAFNRARIAASRVRIPLTPLGWKTAITIGAAVLVGLFFYLKGN